MDPDKTIREERGVLNRLATLLANGVEIVPGQPFPAGWDESRDGKRRRLVVANEEQLAGARALLGWNRPGRS
jgi:hypothetical protein